MPEEQISDTPAAAGVALAQFAQEVDKVIPHKKADRNLLIGTWNLRAFGGLTKSWQARPADSPKRNFRDVACIAEIVSRFDVVALQEVRGDLRALRHLLKRLGDHWAFLLTDVTKGPAGNNERLSFLYDTRRVKPSGLACELVVWIAEDSPTITEGTLDRQFARTPYACSFATLGPNPTTFILVTLHVDWGNKPGDRIPELKAIAEWLANWAERESTGSTTTSTRPSPRPACSPLQASPTCREQSSTSPRHTTTTTRSPGSTRKRRRGRS